MLWFYYSYYYYFVWRLRPLFQLFFFRVRITFIPSAVLLVITALVLSLSLSLSPLHSSIIIVVT